LVIGSSLRVRPVSLIPGMLPPQVPQILINRESLSHCRFDIELLGNCDEIIAQLCRNLGPSFSDLASNVELQEIDKLPRLDDRDVNIGPKSEGKEQLLKSCWGPRVSENISERLPENSYLNLNPRQYIFQGAEILLDEDEDDDDEEGGVEDDDSSSGSESDGSSISSSEIRVTESDLTAIPELINGTIDIPSPHEGQESADTDSTTNTFGGASDSTNPQKT